MPAASEGETQREGPGPLCLRPLVLGVLLLGLVGSLTAPDGVIAPRSVRADSPVPPRPPPPPWPPLGGEPVPAPKPRQPAQPRAPQSTPQSQPQPQPAAHEHEHEHEDPAAKRPFIRRIEFEGNLLYAAEMLKMRLRTKEGSRLDPALLDLDMAELYRYFREIQVVEQEEQGGIVLRFRVSENPLILRLDIRGNEDLDNAEIKDLLRTREGFPLSPHQLAADREDVAEAYRLRGYHFAQVPEPEIITLPNGGRRVIFTVIEGPDVTVSRIVLRGHSHLQRKDLLKAMVTQTPNFLEVILGETLFRKDVLDEDLVSIKQLYRSHGFLDAEVALDDLRFSDDKSQVEISISITEHRPYTVGTITFEIERQEPGTVASPTADDISHFTDENLLAWFGLKTGQRFSGMRAKHGLMTIKSEYSARSYINANVGDIQSGTVKVRGRERELVVDLLIPIREGPKFRLARIDFVGNEYTRDKILRREVKTAPGGYIDRRRLDQGLAAINRLGYFDRATLRVDDALDAGGERIEGWKRATYELVEGSTGDVTFGLAMSTGYGFSASVQFKKRNFDIARWPASLGDISSGRAWTGAGQEFDLLLNPGTEVSQFRARFREPRFFGTHVSFETSVYKRLEYREDYRTDRFGYTLGLGYPLYHKADNTMGLTTELTWRHEFIDIDDVEFDAVPGVFLFADENELRSLALNLSFVTRNDSIKPTFETSSGLTAEWAGGFLGGDLNFWTLSGRSSAVWVVHEDDEGKKHRVSARLTAGIQEATGSTPEVPPYERFYAGGRTFRGFEFRGVGPHINGQPTGGEFMLTSSLEYEFPLVARTLSVVAFSDQGTVGTSFGADDAFLWRWSVGLGLRFAIPFLTGRKPMALDFGFPIYSEREDEKSVFSFSLGRDL